jgi:hypothetical protein
VVQKEQEFFRVKNIKFSFFFIGSATGLILIFFMMYVIFWLLSNSPWGKSELLIGVAILLLFFILLLGHIGKKINNQFCVNISHFLAGFYIFGFLLAFLLDILFFISALGFWDFLFQ